MASPRWLLRVRAIVIRFILDLVMILHKYDHPRPISPSFTETIRNNLASEPGDIKLHFYNPPSHARRRPDGRKYPIVINFHGGGFVLGRGTDDARWITVIVEKLSAIVVSVDYRLAPEHPFPAGVEDGAYAIHYLVKEADRYGIDVSKIALSGFSAGGTLAFTIPIQLQLTKPVL